jgi:hypothetical protein
MKGFPKDPLTASIGLNIILIFAVIALVFAPRKQYEYIPTSTGFLTRVHLKTQEVEVFEKGEWKNADYKKRPGGPLYPYLKP